MRNMKYTYQEIKLRNESGKKAYKAGKRILQYTIRKVNLRSNICYVNGEWSNIECLVCAVAEQKICVTNLSALRNWKGFIYA